VRVLQIHLVDLLVGFLVASLSRNSDFDLEGVVAKYVLGIVVEVDMVVDFDSDIVVVGEEGNY